MWNETIEQGLLSGLSPALLEDAQARAAIYNEDGDTDDEMSLSEAFFEMMERAEEASRSDDPDWRKQAKADLLARRKFLIAVGYYVEFTEQDAAAILYSSRPPWDFTLGGKRYWHNEA